MHQSFMKEKKCFPYKHSILQNSVSFSYSIKTMIKLLKYMLKNNKNILMDDNTSLEKEIEIWIDEQ